MAAPRATQFIALRNLAKGSHQVRSLHMTGPATYASTVLTKERPVLDLPRDIAGLRAECKKRKIETTGDKQELISRLHTHSLTSSRAFSSAVAQSNKPTPPTTTEPASVRHFNTSRTLKAVRDTSTMDFAYLPEDFSPDSTGPSSELLRVPIISSESVGHAPVVVEETLAMKPQISTMSADAVILPLSEADTANDNNEAASGAPSMTERIRQISVKPVEQQAGIVKQIWNDLMDDVLGARKKSAAA